MGKEKIESPIMTAWGVKSNAYRPRGPDRDRKEYTINPMTTVGRAIRLLRMAIMNLFPRNFFRPRNTPNGKLNTVQIEREIEARVRDVRAIW